MHLGLAGCSVSPRRDDPDSLELLRLVLEGAGASILAAKSARDALEWRGPFDVIVSDIGTPEMDGYDFIPRMRSRASGANVSAIALTAYARLEDAERARKAGYDEHIAKPVNAGDLIAIADRLVHD